MEGYEGQEKGGVGNNGRRKKKIKERMVGQKSRHSKKKMKNKLKRSKR